MKIQQIDYACNVGDRVYFLNVKKEKSEGKLVNWNGDTATILLDDGTEKEIKC